MAWIWPHFMAMRLSMSMRSMAFILCGLGLVSPVQPSAATVPVGLAFLAMQQFVYVHHSASKPGPLG